MCSRRAVTADGFSPQLTLPVRSSAAQARITRDLARKNVDDRQQKYEIGGIAPFELLDAQNRLASVEGALVAAHAAYQKSAIAYKRATWTLLEGLGAIVETPAVR